MGVGEKNPHWFEQAASWQVVRHPGQITQPCKTVIWWNFTDQLNGRSSFWSAAEREALLKNHIELENPRTVRKRETLSWKRPLQYAEENLLMLYPEKRMGEEIYPHPLWDEIRNLALNSQSGREEDEVISCLVRESSTLQKDGLWELAGRTAVLDKVEEESVKPITDHYLISKDLEIEPSSMSYSQMNTIISCPMKWLLQYHGNLSPADVNALPTGNQMIGSLCHLIIQELYIDPGHKWTPEKAEEKAGKLYDSLVPSAASELLLEGRELDNIRYRSAVMRAVRDLVTAITGLGLTVEKSEEKIEADLNGVPFSGYIDLLLRDREGNPFVIDIKWSGSARYKKEEVEMGEALQLASYSWLLKSAHKASSVHSAYFMLAQGELLSDSPLLKDEAITSEYTTDQIWEMGVRSLKENLLSLRKGRIEAGGVKVRLLCEAEGEKKEKIQDDLKNECNSKGILYQKPVCGFCDFTVLCNMAGGKS
jgi:ATP-dependent helicase/nuclease subunit B